MRPLDYQRFVICYHGCDARVRDDVLSGKKTLEVKQNAYDWLGHGIYFWEHGPKRALEWAHTQKKRNGSIKSPAVIGCLLNLGQCFDLLDATYTDALAAGFPLFQKAMGENIPVNKPAMPGDEDLLLRYLDCATINWVIDETERASGLRFHSVRGVFQEGGPAFPNSGIRLRSHIQIAVRDTACILGYFMPHSI